MDSALKQALAALSKSTNGLKTSLKKFSKKSNKEENNSTAIRDRVARGATPVQQLSDGSLLFSDGSVRPSQTMKDAVVLRDNVLDQYAWTKEAKDYLRSLPVSIFDIQAEGANSGYMTLGRYHPEIENQKKGISPYGYIDINLNTLYADPSRGGKTMAHEMIHALDRNSNFDGETTITGGPRTANSAGFYENLSRSPDSVSKSIDKFLLGYEDTSTLTRDRESFAELGERKGQDVLLTPQAPAYSDIFEPMTPNMNYTPRFPVKDIYEDMIRTLSEGEPK